MAFKKILVPVDFSTFSQTAMDYALFLAEKYYAQLTLFHVVLLFQEDIDDEEHLETLEKIIKKREKKRSILLKSSCTDAEKRGVEVNHTMVHGFSAADSILESIADNVFDLVVLGTHGHTGLKKWIYGSVAEKVVRLSPIPVLTTHMDIKRKAITNILVPVDFSNHSERAIQFSKTLALDFKAKLTFLHSIEQEAHPAFYAISTAPILEENPELKNRILKNLIKFTEMAEGDAEYAITEGKAHKQIGLYAKENSIDLIVMATRGLSKLEHFLIGSNAERVVATAPCPVLTIERAV
ncbi:universal stress protein [bacterium]|nr:universal stress protein [bacterium]